MNLHLDHIAVLVESIELASNDIDDAWSRGDVERFEAEGTAERYLGDDSHARILLVEAIGDGPYRNAQNKRGTGLHHIGFNTPNTEETLSKLHGSGWYLHPKSLETFRTNKTVWMCHAGAQFLVELHQSDYRPKPCDALVVPATEFAVQKFPMTAGDDLNIRIGRTVFRIPRRPVS